MRVCAVYVAVLALLLPAQTRANEAEQIANAVCKRGISDTASFVRNHTVTSCQLEFVRDDVRYIVRVLTETSVRTVVFRNGPKVIADHERWLTFSVFDPKLHDGQGDPLPLPELYVSVHAWNADFTEEVGTGMRCHAGIEGDCTLMLDRFNEEDDGVTGETHRTKWQKILNRAVRETRAYLTVVDQAELW